MATIIKRVEYHICHREIMQVDSPDLWLGSIVECSCRKRFIKSEDSRGETYWPQTAPDPEEHRCTAHGHRCCDIVPSVMQPRTRQLCGGPDNCTECRSEADLIHGHDEATGATSCAGGCSS